MKDRFSEIILLRKQIQELFHRLEEKKKSMKDHYATLVTNNEHQFFGLDSFRFQVKLAENELIFLNDQFILIDNRLYCDYYKLYNHVYDYYVANLPNGVAKSVFPIYKDLEPTKVYDPDMVHKLYRDILLLIHKAYDTLDHEHRKRETEKRLTTSGIHIGNYVHNRVFTDTLIKTNIQLFEEYLNTYFIYHMTFLVNLKERLGMFLDHVLRRQSTEQVCDVNEVDDNFMNIAKDPIQDTVEVEPVSETKSDIDEPIVSVVVSETPNVSVVEPAAEQAEPPNVPVAEQVETPNEPVVEPAETPNEPVAEQSETPNVPVVEPLSEQSETPNVPVVEPAEAPNEPVAEQSETPNEPVVEPAETPNESVIEQVETPIVPVQPDERSVEDVINPLIDHLLGNEPGVVPTKKKKRPRKPK
jgi:hypothetical protein